MKTIGWLLILACAGSLRARAQEGGEGSPVTAILALENAWAEAESRSDNGALDRIIDNAAVYIKEGRLLTKGDYLLRVRLAGAQPRQLVAGAAMVRIFGSAAIVVGTYREIGVKDGKVSPRRWRFIDTWVNKNGSWMLVATGAAPLSK